MSLPIPIAVRLQTSRADMHITQEVRDVEWRSIANGGFASASISLDRPLKLQPDEMSYYGKAYLYDKRNGRTLWEGRLEDPGRAAGPDGYVWDIKALGPRIFAYDRTVPLIYVDKQLDRWVITSYSQPMASAGQRDPGVWQIAYNNGFTVVNGMESAIMYDAIEIAGQYVARCSVTYNTGCTSVNMLIAIVSWPSVSYDTSVTATPGTGTLVVSLGGSPALTANSFRVDLDVRRITNNFLINNDTFWFTFANPIVRARLKDKLGNDITTGYTADTVLSMEVVADLLGRLLTMYDGAGATIATTTYAIDQLAYPDGVTPGGVLDDLIKLEPTTRWGVWESNAAGKYRFEFQAWPTLVRYETDERDGYNSTGSAEGLYDAVRVRYRTANGQSKTVRRTQTVPELVAAGFSREAFIDLGDNVGSDANAAQAGDNFLMDHKTPPNAGTLTLARPVLDLVTGAMVQPWEVLPGHLIRVRGITPRLDPLNATTRDGTTVFRIASHSYRTSTAHATLELDSFAPSTARQVADLLSRPEFRRR